LSTSSTNGNGKGNGETRLRLLFADRGEFHSLTVTVPTNRIAEYDRLVDLLREEPSVTRQLYVDMRRLVSATVEEE